RRREMQRLLIGFAGLGVLLLLACAASLSAAAQHDKPNIVFILADDMGYGDARCYNPESKVPTPNLDKLATQGMRFTDAHSPSSVCTPTRYAFLTGRYGWRTALKSSVLWPWDPPLLEDERVTIPEMLRATESQYATAAIGKWHLGWVWPSKDGKPIKETIARISGGEQAALARRIDFTKPIKGGPNDHGFDLYFGDDVPNFPPYTFFENDRLVAVPTQTKPKSMFGSAGPMAPGWELRRVQPTITERAIEYIKSREDRGEPFFLYMPLNIPHTPIVPNDPHIGKSEAGRYGDFIVQTDAIVGRVVQALEQANLADNTIVIFTSDNGSPARDGHAEPNKDGRVKGAAPHSVTKAYGHVPNAPWRGLKGDTWEAGHRVPHIVRWPGVVKPGSVSEQVVCHTDWYATFAEIHGMKLADDQAEDSFSLMPILRGIDKPIRESVIHHSAGGTFAIRKGDWKLIEGNLGSGGFSPPRMTKPKQNDPQGQLYNLRDDPKEANNLWLDEPEKVKELLTELNAIRDAGRSR
ncbi:MAG: sulfatase family protein, partial [Phycisphaeraceae bacterium]